jgi:cohesin loading factor subunit SCC2
MISYRAKQVSSLDDVKSNSQAENNAAKQTALEHLGVIAAKIHITVLKFQRETTDDSAKKLLHPLEDVSSQVS